jgi:hypothetical protein
VCVNRRDPTACSVVGTRQRPPSAVNPATAACATGLRLREPATSSGYWCVQLLCLGWLGGAEWREPLFLAHNTPRLGTLHVVRPRHVSVKNSATPRVRASTPHATPSFAINDVATTCVLALSRQEATRVKPLVQLALPCLPTHAADVQARSTRQLCRQVDVTTNACGGCSEGRRVNTSGRPNTRGAQRGPSL